MLLHKLPYRVLATALAAVLLSASLAAWASRWESGENDLLEAARLGHLERVRTLLAQGAEIDLKNRYGATALTFATEKKHPDVVRLLLEEGADPNVRDNFYGQTPLSWSLDNETHDISVLLLQHGADEASMALLYGVRSGHVPLITAALATGPIYDFHLETALAIAQQGKNAQAAELLKTAETKEAQFIELDRQRLTQYAGTYQTASASDMNLFVSWPLPRGEGLGLMQHVIMGEIRGEIEAGSQTVQVVVAGQGLSVRFGQGEENTFMPISATEFRSVSKAGAGITFFGRTGLTEGLVVTQRSTPSIFSRRETNDFSSGEAPDQGSGPASVPSEADETEPVTSHWPSFRGPNGLGIAGGRDMPVEWNLDSKQGIKWAKDIPGLAHSSPIIWGDRIFLTTVVTGSENDDLSTGFYGSFDSVLERTEHTWKIICLDKSSGRVLWERTAGQAVPLAGRHSKATQANSTPATNGQKVVAVFPTAGLVCYDSQGRLLWKADLGALDSGWFYDPSYEWGFASSPIIYENLVILQADIRENPYIAAWDLETGRQVWKTEREEIPTWSTPAVYRGPSGDVLITNGTKIRGYDPKTGKELWHLGPNSEIIIATPVAGEDLVYVSGGYPPTRAVYAIRPGGRGDFSLPDGRSSSRNIAWSTRRTGSYITTPLLYRGILYLVHHNGRMTAFDAANGKRLYRARVAIGETFTGSPVAADGKLYLVTEEGTVHVIKAGPEFQELASNSMGQPLLATPAISEGTIFVRGLRQLFAITQ